MLELLVLLSQTIVIVAALYLIKRSLESRLNEITTEALSFYAKEKQDIIDNLPTVANVIGDSLFGKFKGMIAGQASGIARLDKGLAQAFTQDAIQGENPLLGMLIEQFPTVKNYISKNPAAIGQLMGMAQQFGMLPNGQQQGLRGGRVPDRLRSMRY